MLRDGDLRALGTPDLLAQLAPARAGLRIAAVGDSVLAELDRRVAPCDRPAVKPSLATAKTVLSPSAAQRQRKRSVSSSAWRGSQTRSPMPTSSESRAGTESRRRFPARWKRSQLGIDHHVGHRATVLAGRAPRGSRRGRAHPLIGRRENAQSACRERPARGLGQPSSHRVIVTSTRRVPANGLRPCRQARLSTHSNRRLPAHGDGMRVHHVEQVVEGRGISSLPSPNWAS